MRGKKMTYGAERVTEAKTGVKASVLHFPDKQQKESSLEKWLR